MAPIDSSGVSLAAGLRWFCKLCTRVHNSKVRTRVSSGSKFACVFWKLLLKISQFRAKIVLQLQQNLAKNHFTTWKSMLLKLPNSIQRQFFPRNFSQFYTICVQFFRNLFRKMGSVTFHIILHQIIPHPITPFPISYISYKVTFLIKLPFLLGWLNFLLGYISYQLHSLLGYIFN